MHEDRYRSIQIRPGIHAVVDSTTGAYYGLTEYQGSVWGARDWAGLSLPVGYPENTERARLQAEARKNHEYWADRLIERADRRGGVPVPEDSETAQGLYEGLLYIGGGESFNVYTEHGKYLGNVCRTGLGRWEAVVGKHTPDVEVLDRTDTRTEAAQRLDWEQGQQAATEAQTLDQEAADWIEENKDKED